MELCLEILLFDGDVFIFILIFDLVYSGGDCSNGYFCGPVVILICQRSGNFRAAQYSRCTNDGRESADNEHPDGFVRRRAGKESGNVRGEGIGGVESDDEEHNSTDEEYKRNDFIHNGLSMTL
jgi:hypothetical protein